MKNDKGFTIIELIATLLIIAVITAIILPKIIDLESNTEKRLRDVVLSELNAREQMAWLGCKMTDDDSCVEEAKTDDLTGVRLEPKDKKKGEWEMIFDGGGGIYPVYRIEDDDYAASWSIERKGKKPKPPKPPKKPKPPKPPKGGKK